MEKQRWKRIHPEDTKDADKRKEIEQKETKGAKKKRFSDRINRMNRMKKTSQAEAGRF